MQLLLLIHQLSHNEEDGSRVIQDFLKSKGIFILSIPGYTRPYLWYHLKLNKLSLENKRIQGGFQYLWHPFPYTGPKSLLGYGNDDEVKFFE